MYPMSEFLREKRLDGLDMFKGDKKMRQRERYYICQYIYVK